MNFRRTGAQRDFVPLFADRKVRSTPDDFRNGPAALIPPRKASRKQPPPVAPAIMGNFSGNDDIM
jgi:hypothetical protein